jgi:hypothetical protein
MRLSFMRINQRKTPMWIKKSTLAVAGIALISLSAARAQEPPAANAVVKGPERRLAEFHQNLLGYLSTSNLDDAAIVCNRDDSPKTCEQLSPTGGTTRVVTYTFFRDYERLMAFALAWGKLQTKQKDKFVTILLNNDIPPPDCAALTQPCVSGPFCRLTPGCDKVYGPPCQKCPTP